MWVVEVVVEIGGIHAEECIFVKEKINEFVVEREGVDK